MSVTGPEVAKTDLPKLDVMLIGPYPPPLGGISAHVTRFAAILISRGLRVGVMNHFGTRDEYPVVEALHRNPLLYTLAMRARVASLVHYHHSSIAAFFVVASTPRCPGSAYIATIHGHDLQPYLESRVTAVAQATRWALRRFDHVVAVSPEVGEALGWHLDASRMTVIPAYLPVGIEAPHASVSAEVEGLLATSSEMLIVSAYRIVMQGRHEDMYGLDIAVEAFSRLAHRHPDLRMGIFLAHPPRGRKAKRFLEELLHRLQRQDIGDRMAVVVGESLVSVFARDVIYLRPSRTDGDAVSIREALAAGVPVLASDVILRPKGTQVLPTEDVDAWCRAITRRLKLGQSQIGTSDHPPTGPNGTSQSHAGALLELYARYVPEDVASRLHKADCAESPAQGSAYSGTSDVRPLD